MTRHFDAIIIGTGQAGPSLAARFAAAGMAVARGNDMNGYADDLADLMEALDLRDATLVGHSTGGGEVTRYIARHGSKRVAKAVLIAAVPPIMLKTQANPEGLPMEVFDGLRAGLVKDRSQFYKDLAIQFYGANRPGATVSHGTTGSILALEHASRPEECV